MQQDDNYKTFADPDTTERLNLYDSRKSYMQIVAEQEHKNCYMLLKKQKN